MISDLRAIASALGGVVCGGQVLAPGPNHGRRDRSLSVRLSPSSPLGFLVHSYAGDPFDVCQRYVADRLGLDPNGWKATDRGRSRPQPRPQTTARPDGKVERTAAALALWNASVDPRGTLAERYLAGRGLELEADASGEVLRWNPGCCAMIALFRNIVTDAPQAISRTFFDAEGRKLERFLGPVGGAAVKLDDDSELLAGLHIGEGIETCMAARQLGLRPCWALGSKGAIGGFPVLAGVEALTILAEPDAEKEAQACAARWHSVQREVLITRASGGGAKDANDIILAIRA
jgi:putative DNA primase/helicase